MTHLNLTTNEKLLIYMAFNGTCINRFYAEDPDRILKVTEAEAKAYGTPDEIVHRITSYLEYNTHEIESYNVAADKLLEKLSKLNYNETRQIRNEIYAFWNGREMLELLNYCNLLIKNTHVVNNEEYKGDGFASLKRITKRNNHEPIIWTPEDGPLQEFLQVAKGLDMDYIIYVNDIEGNKSSVWASAKEDLVDCMIDYSELFYFGRLQEIDIALNYGFLGIDTPTVLN